PGQDHQPPRTAIALLETGRDGAEPIAANLPVLHAATLAAQRPRGDFEDAARVRLAVGAGAVAEHARAGHSQHALRQRSGIPVFELLEGFDDSAAVGDWRQQPADRAQISVD